MNMSGNPKPRLCEYCRKSSTAPCETKKQGDKCSRNNNSKKAIKNRNLDIRSK